MVLDFIEKYKFAIIGTVVFHVFIFLYTNFITVKRPYKLVEPIVEVAMPLEDIEFDPEMMKLLELNQKPTVSEEIYNLTSDANDSRERSYENFSTQEMDQQVLENAKSLEEQYFNEWEGTHENSSNNKSSADIQDKNQNKQNNQNNPDKTIDTSGDKAFAGEVMASFDLKDRKALKLEKPGYTCNTSGTVVLQIKVDNNGAVRDATYSSSGSSNATECMIQQAIKYAKRSLFSFSSSAPASQTGTITYKFVSK